MTAPNTAFSEALDAIGLTSEEAAELLGVSVDSIKAMRKGAYKPKVAFMTALLGVWKEVESGRITGLPAGAQARSRGLKELRRWQRGKFRQESEAG